MKEGEGDDEMQKMRGTTNKFVNAQKSNTTEKKNTLAVKRLQDWL